MFEVIPILKYYNSHNNYNKYYLQVFIINVIDIKTAAQIITTHPVERVTLRHHNGIITYDIHSNYTDMRR